MRRAFTLVETLTVVAIVGILMALLGFVVGPAVKESGTKTVCASNMKQIVSAYRLYMADNDNQLPQAGWNTTQMRRYIATRPDRLFCPKAASFRGTVMSPYVDEQVDARLHESEVRPQDRMLPDGRRLPSFDPERDAILKCAMHGRDGYVVGDTAMTIYDETNAAGRVLTAYLDGRVAYAPFVPCWRVAYMRSLNSFYSSRNDLLPFCDGNLETKP